MKEHIRNILKSIALVFTGAMLFFSCSDEYKRVGDEAVPIVYPQGVAENFSLTYTETTRSLEPEDIDTTRVISVISGPVYELYDNLEFPYNTFPESIKIDLFDEKNNKTVITADYGIRYIATNLIDLQGNVVIERFDGKKLETPQLFYDHPNSWVFTQNKFKYTNPEEGTVMDGEGMDFNTDFTFLNAQKTFGIMTIMEDKEERND